MAMVVSDFDDAVEKVRQLTNASNEDLLSLYKFFKQATVGKCNTARPGMFDLKGKAKWDAWNSIKDMNSADAKKAYIELANKLLQAK